MVTWTLTPTKGGVLLRMEQSGFRPEDEANYQGAGYGWQRFVGGGCRAGLTPQRGGSVARETSRDLFAAPAQVVPGVDRRACGRRAAGPDAIPGIGVTIGHPQNADYWAARRNLPDRPSVPNAISYLQALLCPGPRGRGFFLCEAPLAPTREVA